MAALLGCLVAARAPAQSEDAGAGGALQEVVVTAEKRAERIGDVPISISAYTTQEMDVRGIRDITDVASVTPGVIYTSSGAFNNISIRGITSTATSGAALAALYIDDVPVQVRTGLGGFRTNLPQIFDLDRVEVLRGPQGTLFGASAMGGAIRFISPEASLTEHSGYLRSEIAETEGGALSDEVGVAYGGPIVDDKLGFRVSAWHRTDGGYINDESALPGGVHQTNANSEDRYAARAALTFAATDLLKVTASLFTQEVNDNDLGKFYPVASNPDDNRFVKTDLLLSPMSDKLVLPSLKVQAALGWADLTSNTGYFHRTFSQYVDYTTVIPAALGDPPPTSADQYQVLAELTSQNTFIQEVRLSSPADATRLKWTAGAYYSDARQYGIETILSPMFPGGGQVDGGYSYKGSERFDDEELAGFVNLEYALPLGFSVIAGARVSKLTDHYHSGTEGPLAGPTTTVTGLQKANPVTPKFGISYKVDEDNLLYASAAKGYRSGGSNAPITIPNDACQEQLDELHLNGQPAYSSDSLWSYEVGSKNNLLGGRLVLEASAFHIKWQNIQRTVSIPVCTSGLTLNLGSATSNGFDLALGALLTSHLKADLDIGYTSAKTAETVSFSGVTYAQKGDQIADYPPWTITAALQYDLTLPRDIGGYVRVENRYNSKNDGSFSFLNPANTGAYNQTQGIDASVENLIFRAGIVRHGLDLSAFVNNALNQHPLLGVVTTEASSGYGAQTIRPLTVGLTGVYRW